MKKVKLRPAVNQFSIEMEKVLKENDYKGGWWKVHKEYFE
jgi:hypothetical protein